MNSKKRGKLFAVLMIALIAYGFASSISLITGDSISLEIPSFNNENQSQVTIIGNPNFNPVMLKQRVIINITNNTTDDDIINDTPDRNRTPTNNSTLHGDDDGDDD